MFIPLEILLIVCEFLSLSDLVVILEPLFFHDINFDKFIDLSQLCGYRCRSVIDKSMIRKAIVSETLTYFIDKMDLGFFVSMVRLLKADQLNQIFNCRINHHIVPGFCYSRLFNSKNECFIVDVLGPLPTVRFVHYMKDFLELLYITSAKESRKNVVSFSTVSATEENHIYHVKPWTCGEDMMTGSGFFRRKFVMSNKIGKPEAVKVALTSDELEDEILSLAGGNGVEILQSKQRVENWNKKSSSFEVSCEKRFNALELAMEKILNTLEMSTKESVSPNDSASRSGHRKYHSDSILPVIEEVTPTEFSLVHPGWNPIQYETDLNLAIGCSGVSNGEVQSLPDPGAGGLVPSITIDQRLNFLIRIHTALFKLLTEGVNYPGKNFLIKFKELRDGKLTFDHPSLDLLEIVLEDTVDWRRHVVKRNLFKIPGFHPGLLLNERIIGKSLLSLKEEYKIRWNSLVGDCVLPSMLSSSEWSDDRRDLSDGRTRRHRVSDKRRQSDRRSTHESRTGYSNLSNL